MCYLFHFKKKNCARPQMYFICVRTVPVDAEQQDLILESESGQIQICAQLSYPRLLDDH